MRPTIPLVLLAVVIWVSAFSFYLLWQLELLTYVLVVIGFVPAVMAALLSRNKPAESVQKQSTTAPVAPAEKVEPAALAAPAATETTVAATTAQPTPSAETPTVVSIPKPEAPAETPVLTAPTAAPELSAPAEVPALSSAAPTAPVAVSDLTKIRGINAKRAEQLNANGINSVADLAKASPADLAAKLGVSDKIVKMWIGSAKKLTK